MRGLSLLALLLVAVLCASCGVSAVVGGVSRGRSSIQQRQVRALGAFFALRLDRNGDGRCDHDEYRAYMEGMDPEDMPNLPFPLLAERFAELDSNGDGALTVHELCVSLRICTSTNDSSDARMQVYDAATAPMQLHLSLTDTFATMLVSWAQNTTAPAPSATGAAEWDTVSHANDTEPYAFSAEAIVTNYTVAAVGLSYSSVPLFTAALSKLPAATRIYYRVGNDQDGWSEEYSFFTFADPSLPSTASLVSKMLVVGDMGTTIPMGSTVTQWMEAELESEAGLGVNFTIHVGDLAYAGVNAHEEWEPTWDAWMTQIEPIASKMAYVTSVGNHESYFNFTSFLHRFTMPSASSKGNEDFWFSFDQGGIHFTSINTEDSTAVGSPMYEWLLADLTQAVTNAASIGTQWIVLLCHRPLYSSDMMELPTHVPGSAFLTTLEPLLVKFGVALVLTGHQHMYERTYPVINGTVFNTTAALRPTALVQEAVDADHKSAAPLPVYANPNAPVYVVQGTAGAMQFETLLEPAPAWSAFRQWGTYGFGVLSTATNLEQGTTSLMYQFKGNEARTVVDQFIIQKNINKKKNSGLAQKNGAAQARA